MKNSATDNLDVVIHDFQWVFNEYHDRLLFFCEQILGDTVRAQDVVQEAFLRYWSVKDTVADDLIAIKNYLYSSVRNLSFNAIRHEKVVSNFAGKQDIELFERSTMEAIISAEVLSEVHAAILSLPDKYRTLSWMAFVDGKKNAEIAEELALSINTLKKQKQKALELLKLSLRPDTLALLILLHNV